MSQAPSLGKVITPIDIREFYQKVPIPEPKTEFTDIPQVDERGNRLESFCFLNQEGKVDGQYTEWFTDRVVNQVRLKIHYLQGKRHGKYIEYHFNGTIKQERMYHSGLLNGEFTTYHDNGQLFTQVLYVNDKKQGFMKRYSETGVLLDTQQYHNNIQVGECRTYLYR